MTENRVEMSKPDSFLFNFSIFSTVCTGLLILAGGLVTSHEAGLAVPDWPLSYGQWFPPMVGNIFWEHGHRMIAGTVAILTLIQAIWIQKTEQRKWLKMLGWIAVGAVLFQALLGGLTVLNMLPALISITHACLAQTFFCLMVSITYFLNPAEKKADLPASFSGEELESIKRLKRLLILTTIFVYVQLILGAIVRHTGEGIVFHIILAFIILLHVLFIVLRVQRSHNFPPMLSKLSLGLGVLVLVQIFLGLGSFIFTKMLERGYSPSLEEVVFTASHQTIGALILAGLVLMTLRVFQWIR